MRGGSIRVGFALAASLFVAACSTTPHRPPHGPAAPPRVEQPPKIVVPPPPPPPRNAVEAGVSAGPPVSSLDLSVDQASAARDAFKASCRSLMKRKEISGLTQPIDWAPACAAAAIADTDPVAFFQTQFETLLVSSGAFFATGYYAPEIEGSRTHDTGFDVPVYRRPPDLVEMDSGVAAGGAPSGKKVRGRLQDGQFGPYYDRAAIDAGALANQGLEIAWVQDPVELFFLEIQGSGRLHLPDGSYMWIGYDTQNGYNYTGIGKMMRDRGLIGPNTTYATSMQGIKAYLADHPDERQALMEENKSVVFFHELPGGAPLGAMGAPVIGHVSVAADPNFTPLGAPLWLSADRTEVTGLWVAQDTGGAIKGANRIDTYWGAGVIAAITAGGMSAHGQMLILVPRGTIEKLRPTLISQQTNAAGAAPQR
ncbi:MAG TPA: MltA domain-containing protein [Sphingomonas sp.]|uniref:murein transglycosylase A n=1 Tax=Sphingomonas sp. TaxID=28214 RepID=UPI002CC2C9E5|nr:MltA domain-containing protein [Sphingomonas sp.]HMI21016.1 MltA domain-containing protein [Sphingomonas sp.]